MQTQAQPASPRPLPLPPAHIWHRTPALVEALDKKRQPPPRGKASDALGKQVLDLLWRPLEDDDDEGIWQRMAELQVVFDAVPDDQAGALLKRLDAGGNLQRDFDYRLHRASRRRLRAGLAARATTPAKPTQLQLKPTPPVVPIPPHQLPPYVPPLDRIPKTVTPGTLSPQFIVGWKWTSERRRLSLPGLLKKWANAPALKRLSSVADMVEAYLVIEVTPRVHASVPGSLVVETKLLFDRSGVSGEIEADFPGLPGTAKFGMEGGKPSLDLSVKGSLSRFELQAYFNGDGVLRGLLPDGPPFARVEGKTTVEFGSYTVKGLDVPVSVECEIVAAVEFRWSLGGILRKIGEEGGKRLIDRLKDWLKGVAGRALALWGRRVWWVLGAGLLLWWLLDDDDAPDEDLERFDPKAWELAHRWAAAQPHGEKLIAAIDEAADAAQESFGIGLADTLRHLQTLGNRASGHLETMAAGPYGSNNGFGNLPSLDAPFDRWVVWSLTSDAAKALQSSIDMGQDDWRGRMRIVQRVAMAGHAARASGHMTRAAWISLLAKIKWHANAAGIACAVQSLRGWRDDNDFTFLDEKGKRQKHDGSAQLTNAFKLIAADGRSEDTRRERLRRIAWMILAE